MYLKSQYTSLTDFRLKDPLNYFRAKRKGLLKYLADYYGWEFKNRLPMGYWTKERVFESSKDYNNPKDWKIVHQLTTKLSKKVGMKKRLAHMNKKKATGYWDKDKVIEGFKKYNNKKDVRKNDYALFRAAQNIGIIKEATAHMESLEKPPMTVERCIKIARQFKNKTEFNTKARYAYDWAKRNGCFEQCIAHIK